LGSEKLNEFFSYLKKTTGFQQILGRVPRVALETDPGNFWRNSWTIKIITENNKIAVGHPVDNIQGRLTITQKCRFGNATYYFKLKIDFSSYF